jgi:hypothetical protein
MTREEWIAEIPKSVFTACELSFEQYANDACEQIDILVNCIIDDFENRTCENCKYWGYFDSDVLFETCNFGNIEHSYRADSFLCNRWEPKNEV